MPGDNQAINCDDRRMQTLSLQLLYLSQDAPPPPPAADPQPFPATHACQSQPLAPGHSLPHFQASLSSLDAGKRSLAHRSCMQEQPFATTLFGVLADVGCAQCLQQSTDFEHVLSFCKLHLLSLCVSFSPFGLHATRNDRNGGDRLMPQRCVGVPMPSP